MSLLGSEKDEIVKRGQQWAKEENEGAAGCHLRPIGQILFDLDGNNQERRDAFQAGVDNYNETIARNEANSSSYSFTLPKFGNNSGNSDDSPSSTVNSSHDSTWDSESDDDYAGGDSSTSYTSSPSVPVKKEGESGGLLTGAPLGFKLLFVAVIAFIDFSCLWGNFPENEHKVKAQAPTPSAPTIKAPTPEIAAPPAPAKPPPVIAEPKTIPTYPSTDPFSSEGADGIVDEITMVTVLEATDQRLPGTQVVIQFNDGSRKELYLPENATIKIGDHVHVWLYNTNQGTLVLKY